MEISNLEKVKVRNVEMAFINVVLYPTEKQKPEEYINLLSSIMGSRVMVQSSRSDKSTLLRQFNNMGDYYHGYFCNAIFLKENSKTLNVKNNTLEDAEVDPNKGLEANDMEFWFFPRHHRFAVYKANVKKISRFLYESFKFKLGDTDSFDIFVEKDKSSIDRIIESNRLVRVTVSVKYTNNDNCEDWEALSDDLRESGTIKAEFKVEGNRKSPILVWKNKILTAFLKLSKSYGTAKADIINDNGQIEKVDTAHHPKTKVVDLNQNPADELGKIINGISTNQE